MRYASRRGAGFVQGDWTPMIDMTFQLIAFFMVLVNFAGGEQSQRILLPSSELAKPPDAPLESPITIQLTSQGTVLFAGEERVIGALQPLLLRERQVLDATPGKSHANATIIIRADRNAKTGKVQEVIKVCQETGFEKFALRAKQEQRT